MRYTVSVLKKITQLHTIHNFSTKEGSSVTHHAQFQYWRLLSYTPYTTSVPKKVPQLHTIHNFSTEEGSSVTHHTQFLYWRRLFSYTPHTASVLKKIPQLHTIHNFSTKEDSFSYTPYTTLVLKRIPQLHAAHSFSTEEDSSVTHHTQLQYQRRLFSYTLYTTLVSKAQLDGNISNGEISTSWALIVTSHDLHKYTASCSEQRTFLWPNNTNCTIYLEVQYELFCKGPFTLSVSVNAK